MPQGPAARGKNPKKRKAEREPNPILRPEIFDLTKGSEHIQAAADFFEENGFVVCKFKEGTHWVRKHVLELWINFYENDGRLDDYKIKVKDNHGNVLNPNNPGHQEKFLDIVMGPLSKDLSDQYWKLAGLHKTFGASATAESFNLKGQWELRQNPELCKLAQAILKVLRLFMSLDRAKHVAAKHGGQEEFMHIENCKVLGEAWRSLDDPTFEPKKPTSVSGIVNISGCDLYFHCVPGSHLLEYQQVLVSSNEKLCGKKMKGGKLTFNPDDDELGLLDGFVAIEVPPGHYIAWNEDLIHETQKNKTPYIIYGFYIGYLTAMRPEYKDKAGVTEMEDRQNVYEDGGWPKRYPSLDWVQPVPALIEGSLRHLMESHVRMYPRDDERLFTKSFKKTEKYPVGQELLWWKNLPLTQIRPGGYTPPPLSPLGKMLLGTMEWDQGLAFPLG